MPCFRCGSNSDVQEWIYCDHHVVYICEDCIAALILEAYENLDVIIK